MNTTIMSSTSINNLELDEDELDDIELDEDELEDDNCSRFTIQWSVPVNVLSIFSTLSKNLYHRTLL